MTPRIAYLCGEYPTATNTFIQREVAGLRAAGIHVETFAVRQPHTSERGGAEQEEERRRTTYLLSCPILQAVWAHIRLIAASPIRYFRALSLALTVRSPGAKALLYQVFYFIEAGILAAELKRRELGHLHNHTPDSSGYVTMIASCLAGITYSLTIHGFGILSEPARWRLTDKLERSLFAICVSWNARSQAMLWTRPQHWERFHVVHCGVDPNKFVPGNCIGSRRLLYVGRLHYVKGLPLLLEAVASLRDHYPDIHLDIVGDGPERGTLEKVVQERGMAQHVTFHGYWSQARLREYLPKAGTLVMASFVEGVPVVLMEAMAAGVPVIAPRVGGVAELVEDQVTGLLVHPGSVDDLTSRIELMLSNEQLRTRCSRNGRRRVEQEFSLELEISRLVSVMKARLAGQPAPIRPIADGQGTPLESRPLSDAGRLEQ